MTFQKGHKLATGRPKGSLNKLTKANRIYSHIQTVNDVNELIIAGTYYEQKSLVVGNQPTNGIFYFTNKEKKKVCLELIHLTLLSIL